MSWKDWGIYGTMIVEGGISNAGDTAPVWDKIESDYAESSYGWTSGFGSGMGLIQLTATLAFNYLRDCQTNGADFSGMPDGDVKNDIINGTQSAHWSGTSLNGGTYTADEMHFLKTIMNSDIGKNTMITNTKNYFDVTNKGYVDMIAAANCPDEVKAFMMNMCVLAPAYVRQLCNPPVSQTLDGICSDAKQLITWSGYEQRFNTVRDFLKGKDMNSDPPFSIYNYNGGSGTSTPTTPPKTPAPGHNNGNNAGGAGSTHQQATVKPPAKIEVDSGDFYLKNNILFKMGDKFSLTRYNNHLMLNLGDNTSEKRTQVKNDNDVKNAGQTAVKPIPDHTGSTTTDKNKIIDEVIADLEQFPDNHFRYANIRPQGDLHQVDYADCSGFIGWGIRNAHPVVWNNGGVNTASMYALFKPNGFVTEEGDIGNLVNANLERGDIILLTDYFPFHAGNNEHVIMYIGNGNTLDMNGNGNQHHTLADRVNIYINYTGITKYAIVRWVK